MLSLRRNKILSFLVLVFFFAGLFAAFFHFHPEGESSHDCGACRLVQAIQDIFIAIFVAFLIEPLKQRFYAVPHRFLFPSFQLSTSSNRAPPFLI